MLFRREDGQSTDQINLFTGTPITATVPILASLGAVLSGEEEIIPPVLSGTWVT